MGEFGFGQSVRKLPENEGKVLLDETFLKRVISTGNPYLVTT